MANRELPNSEQQFQALKGKGLIRYFKCENCKCEFSTLNIKSPKGWIESQISGFCEDCFDRLFEDFEEA